MTMATKPVWLLDHLPRMTLEGQTRQLQNQNIWTTMDTGRERVRRKYTNVPMIISARFIVDSTLKRRLFWKFYQDVTFAGTIVFDYPLTDEIGTALQEMRFYRETPLETPFTGTKAIITCDLMLLKKRYISDVDYDRIVNPSTLPDWAAGDFDGNSQDLDGDGFGDGSFKTFGTVT